MINLYSTRDLIQYGINPLTGEACAYGMRTLCDLSADGCRLMCDFLGLAYSSANPTWTVFNSNWNSMVGDKQAVASIMLNRDVFPALMRFALFQPGECDYVITQPDGGMVGLKVTDEYCERYLDMARNNSAYRVHQNFAKGYTSGPSVNGRNIHTATGRTT